MYKLKSLLKCFGLKEPNHKHRHCNVILQFRRWATPCKYLGFFPVSKQELRCHHSNLPDDRRKDRCILSCSFIFSFSVFLFFSVSILQPLMLYISVYVASDLNLTSTDKFALQVFLTCVHVLRGIAPIFPVVRVARVMSAVKQMTSYDSKFKVVKGSVAFVDFWILVLFVGSILVLISNCIVSQSDFVDKITSDDDPIFPLSYLLTRSKFITSVFVEAGHAYAEFAICFVVAVMRYISNFIESRMQRIEEEMAEMLRLKRQSPEVQVSVVSLPDDSQTHDAAELKRFPDKVCELVKLLELFNTAFQGYILGFFVFTVILVVVSIYMVVILIRVASLLQGFFFLKHTKVVRGFYALGMTGTHSVFRMVLLINVGERIQNAVSLKRESCVTMIVFVVIKKYI